MFDISARSAADILVMGVWDLLQKTGFSRQKELPEGDASPGLDPLATSPCVGQSSLSLWEA